MYNSRIIIHQIARPAYASTTRKTIIYGPAMKISTGRYESAGSAAHLVYVPSKPTYKFHATDIINRILVLNILKPTLLFSPLILIVLQFYPDT